MALRLAEDLCMHVTRGCKVCLAMWLHGAHKSLFLHITALLWLALTYVLQRHRLVKGCEAKSSEGGNPDESQDRNGPNSVSGGSEQAPRPAM